MRVRHYLLWIIFLALAGCSSVERLAKASPAPDSGFLTNASQMTEQRERFPFNRVWISPEFRKQRQNYKSVILAPVKTSHLEHMDWWQKQSARTQEDLSADADTIARYTHNAFADAIANDPSHRYVVAAKPGPGTLKLEIALVELVPSKAFLNAASTVGGFFVPGAGLAATAGKGSVAIEARLTDSTSGKLLAQMADREEGKSAVVDIAGMSWYSSAKTTIDEWAAQFVRLANSEYTEQVPDSAPFTFVTW